MIIFDWLYVLFIYLVISFFALVVRASYGDCKDRYIDYVLPISFLHCEVK